MYPKWVEIVEVNKMLRKDLQSVQQQKESLEERNYKLMAQLKYVTQKLNCAKSSITRMNRGKATLDEMLKIGDLHV